MAVPCQWSSHSKQQRQQQNKTKGTFSVLILTQNMQISTKGRTKGSQRVELLAHFLPFQTSLPLFRVALRPQRPYGLLGSGGGGGGGGARTATSTLTRLLSSEILNFSFQCCFTSTETIRIIRDGEPWAATSTFTQLLSSELASLEFSISLRPQGPYGLLGTGALKFTLQVQSLFTSTKPQGL